MDFSANKKVKGGNVLNKISRMGGVYIFKTTHLEEQTQLFKL